MTSKIHSRQRRGVVVVYIALALVVLLGTTGLAIDVGTLYLQRDKAQRAADAAALAGAVEQMDGESLAGADSAAEQAAAANGFDVNAGATFTSKLNPDGNDPTYYKVTLTKPAPLFFLSVFGLRHTTVGASATATFAVPSAVSIEGKADYGTGSGPYTISQFGPWGEYNNGDDYDTMYLENSTANPKYVATGLTNDPTGQGGYNYNITIPSNYAAINGTSYVSLDLYDPYCTGSDSTMDEYRAPLSGDPTKPKNEWTTTLYRLYPPAGAPDAGTAIATATCGENVSTGSSNCGASGSKALTWITPDGFQFDSSAYSAYAAQDGTINFRLNAETIDGSSENGYSLRAGPPLTYTSVQVQTGTKTTTKNGRKTTTPVYTTEYQYFDGSIHTTIPTFNQNNGTDITAIGHIEINFDQTGTSQVRMGYVPAGATSVTIEKFDTDVGSESISYQDSATINGAARTTYTGVLNSGNGAFSTDSYNLGTNYPGGYWTVNYKAGATDTSVWNMYFTGQSSTTNGYVYLVR